MCCVGVCLYKAAQIVASYTDFRPEVLGRAIVRDEGIGVRDMREKAALSTQRKRRRKACC